MESLLLADHRPCELVETQLVVLNKGHAFIPCIVHLSLDSLGVQWPFGMLLRFALIL